MIFKKSEVSIVVGLHNCYIAQHYTMYCYLCNPVTFAFIMSSLPLHCHHYPLYCNPAVTVTYSNIITSGPLHCHQYRYIITAMSSVLYTVTNDHHNVVIMSRVLETMWRARGDDDITVGNSDGRVTIQG